jgi:hypothetical protein
MISSDRVGRGGVSPACIVFTTQGDPTVIQSDCIVVQIFGWVSIFSENQFSLFGIML